jgi:hypothetical protein
MPTVTSKVEIENASKNAVNALFGPNVENFRIREVFPYSEDQIVAHSEQMDETSQQKDGWDIQVTFLLNGLQYTVDLIILEKDGQVSYSRVIDKMVPL